MKKKNSGFTIIEFISIIAGLIILSLIGFHFYAMEKSNSYVNAGLSYLDSFQYQISSCIQENNTTTGCDLNTHGISTPKLLNKYKIKSYNVVNGNIDVIFNVKNNEENINNIEVYFKANPEFDRTIPKISWTAYCNDYDGKSNQLYSYCENSINSIKK